MSDSGKPAARLRLRLTNAAEYHVRKRHPWIFASGIRESNRTGSTGELAVIYDKKNEFLGLGLYDADSPIRVRMLHVGKPIDLNEAWWQQRLESALTVRKGLSSDQTTGYRWINGESDGWPGLVLDRYADALVLKLYTAAWFPRLEAVVQAIVSRLAPSVLVLRLSRNIQVAAAVLGLEDGQILHGQLEDPGGRAWFRENGLWFEADLLKGQKTGFFLDQRENRSRVESLSAGRTVLNAFSFTGGFSVYAARGGANSVTSLDLSAHALAGAKRLFERNQGNGVPHSCEHHTIQADAFEWIASAPPGSYDLIILDPPSLARKEVEREGALTGYSHLVRSASRLLKSGGILVAASCSAHVTDTEFFGAVRTAAQAAGRRMQELETTHHAVDHPATFPEASYLKCIYLTDRSG